MAQDQFEGWPDQYRRMLRWRDRLLPLLVEDEPVNGDAVYDFTYAFFQASFHLRDWMLATEPALREPIDALFRTSAPMKLCRDICNSSKQFGCTSPNEEPRARIGFERRPAKWGMPGWYLQSDERWSIKELTQSCIDAWDDFLAQHGQSNLARPELRWSGRPKPI